MKYACMAAVALACIAFTARRSLVPHVPVMKTGKTGTTPAKPAKNTLFILQQKAQSLMPYLEQKGYNTDYCFFIDMRMHPGRKRFFVYALKDRSILKSGLVAHGSGGGSTFETPAFSNSIGSNCTSLGRYRIGQSYYGQFGLAYKLHGLDKTNSNAFNRFVVLHAHDCVPNAEIYPGVLCMSWGCPTVAPDFLQELAPYINRSEKPVILEVYKGD